MGKKYTTRHKARRKFEHALGHLDKANLHIAQVAEWYKGNAGLSYDLMLSVSVIIVEATQLLSSLRERI